MIANGASMEEMVREGFWGPFGEVGTWKDRMNARLRAAQADFKIWKRRRFCSQKMSRWSVNLLSKTASIDPAIFKVKGRMQAYISEFLLDKLKEAGVPTADITDPKSLRYGILWAYVTLFKICSKSKVMLGPHHRSHVDTAIKVLLEYSNRIGQINVAKGSRQWDLIPKHHQIKHLNEECQISGVNPACYWTFGDEDFVNQISKVALRCHASTVVQRTIERHIINFRLKDV